MSFMGRAEGNSQKAKAARKADREAKLRQSESKLVGVDEQIETVAAELLSLSVDSLEPVKELIRLHKLMEDAIAKKRVIGVSTQRTMGAQPPGNVAMAAVALDISEDIRRLNNRRRKQLQRLRAEVSEMVSTYRQRMDSVDGWNDPERARSRIAKSVT